MDPSVGHGQTGRYRKTETQQPRNPGAHDKVAWELKDGVVHETSGERPRGRAREEPLPVASGKGRIPQEAGGEGRFPPEADQTSSTTAGLEAGDRSAEKEAEGARETGGC